MMTTWDMDVAAARKECGNDIKGHHSAIERYGKRTLAHAYCIGESLSPRRDEMKRGQWGSFCRTLPFEKRMAKRYIQLYKMVTSARESGIEVPVSGSVVEAIRALSQPKPPRERKTATAQQTIADTTAQAKPANTKPEQIKLPFEMDEELASIASGGDDLSRVITLVRHDELWIDPARARKTIAKEIIKLYQRLQQQVG